MRRARCLEPGESLNRVPILPKAGWASRAPLTVTATPIRGQGEEPAGCLMVLREHAELLAHPVVQLQIATLSSILENFPIPFFMVDPDLVVTHMNERLERLTGYSSKEVVGRMTCGQVLNTRQCGTCDCVLKQVMETKKPLSGLRRVVRHRDGREIPVTVSASIITDPSGRVIGGFEAIRDITPIIEAEQKIDLLTEHTREGLLMADEKQRVVYVNTPHGGNPPAAQRRIAGQAPGGDSPLPAPAHGPGAIQPGGPGPGAGDPLLQPPESAASGR